MFTLDNVDWTQIRRTTTPASSPGAAPWRALAVGNSHVNQSDADNLSARR
jgi:hypothetical protein